MVDDFKNDTSVKVGVRIRPLLASEIHEGSSQCLRSEDKSKQIIVGNDHSFTFDYVFSENSSQKEVYETSVMPLVEAFFEGFNATVLAYGQTASGKTHTMGSSSSLHLAEEEYGIIPRVVDDIFLIMQRNEASDSNSTYKLRMQYLELYGEEMKDLLDPLSSVRIAIREAPSGEMYLSGVREEQVTSAQEVLRLVERGAKARTTGSTRMNQSSSRSHAIFTLMLEHSIHSSAASPDMGSNSSGVIAVASMHPTLSMDGPEIRKCKFHFVDLAGSERAKRTGAQGLRLKEGIDINRGLLVLGNVISTLGGENKRAHVPYRDSKLTRLLQDSLGGNSQTLMLCCVSPADANYNESLNAVRYANRARNIKNKPVVNIDPTCLIITELKKQIQILASELLLAQEQPPLSFESAFTKEALRVMASSGMVVAAPSKSTSLATKDIAAAHPASAPFPLGTSRQSPRPAAAAAADSNAQCNKLQMIALEKEIVALKEKSRASASSIDFYSDKCDRLQAQLAEHAEELVRAQSERDFFKIKSHGGDSRNSTLLQVQPATISDEDDMDSAQLDVIGSYIRQIKKLNSAIVQLQMRQAEEGGEVNSNAESILETELTSNIAVLFNSTEKQLRSEKKILNRMEHSGNDDDTNGSDEDPFLDVDEDHDEAEQGDTLEVQDKLYQHRTQLMATEVLDISESIHFKEELVHQLLQSQKQYEAMQAFYESKLVSLCEEMGTKELEKQRVVDDLREASQSSRSESQEDDSARREREDKLRVMLHNKELELKALKKQQAELTNLSRVQARSFEQIKRLEADILQLKKQRVSLSKSLQQEKKVFLGSLNTKAKEINKLKKELSLAISKMTKLGKEKEQSTLKVNKMLLEESLRRKKSADARRAGRGAQGLDRAAPPTPSSTRRLLQSLVSTSHKSGGLNINEQKTRSWIEGSAQVLVARDEAIDDLSLQCEQQLVLLHSKKDLEESKKLIASTSGDREALSDIDSAIAKVANQLKFRNTEISRKKGEIDSTASSYLTKDQIAGHLCQMVGTSASDVQNVLKVLFEIILSTQKQLNLKSTKLQESMEKQRALQLELEDAADKLNMQSSNYHREVARVEKEYQAKMSGLFNHSGFRELIQANILQHKADADQILTSSDSGVPRCSAESAASRVSVEEYSTDGFRAAIAVVEERNSTLQSQLQHEEMRVRKLETFVEECNCERRLMQEKYESKCGEIGFLEEECRMLRDIVSDLKSETPSKAARSGVDMSVVMGDKNSDFDDETDSVLGQYSMLREEIISTGSVPMMHAGESAAGHNVSTIFDRLTNPSYFTGTQKNIFKKDVEVNRAKVQQMKGDTNKKDRKRKDEQRHALVTSICMYDSGESGVNVSHDHDVTVAPSTTGVHDEGSGAGLDSPSATRESGEGTPPGSPTAKKVATPSSSRSPSNLNDNVFSRLLNPNKFTGIHRRLHDSPAADISTEERGGHESPVHGHTAPRGLLVKRQLSGTF